MVLVAETARGTVSPMPAELTVLQTTHADTDCASGFVGEADGALR